MNEKVVAAYIQFREIQEEKFGIPFKDHLLFNRIAKLEIEKILKTVDASDDQILRIASDLALPVESVLNHVYALQRWLQDMKELKGDCAKKLGEGG